MARKGQKVARDALADFGKAIQSGRIAKGLTLKQLGFNALGRDGAQGYVSQIENGKRRITPLTAGKLARALDLPMSVVATLRTIATDTDEITDQDIAAETLLDQTRREAPNGQVSEALLIALAYEYAPGSTGDLQSAYAGLQQALAEAVEMKARAALPQNTGDAVQAVLRRVDDLNERGQLDAGQSELDDALARMQAQRATLLDQAAAQARLRNDPATAARRMVDRLRADDPPDLFAVLRALQGHHFAIGQSKGTGFDLALSIDLARHSNRLAPTPVAAATALDDLANSLQTQGTRTAGEAGKALLAEAVATYRQALEVRTRADFPVDWAITMQNLAIALEMQGNRTAGEAGNALLTEAVAACFDALEVFSRVDRPVQWATTMQNLANALHKQGERTAGEAGTALLARAVAAYRDALTVTTGADHPALWAAMIQNYALTMQTQGTRTAGAAGTALLAQAVAAYREALSVTTRADHPVQWAMTMQNLAIALSNQGRRTASEAGTALLAQAVASYRDALTVTTRADHPVQWAMTMHNLASTLAAQGTRTAGEAGAVLMGEAVAACHDALTVRARADHPVHWAMTQENLALIEYLWAAHPVCPEPRSRLRAALDHVDAALTVYDPINMPYNHGTATNLRNHILAALSDAP